HIIALTVSNIDYACVNEVWVYDRATQQQASKVALRIPARRVKLPGTLGEGEVRAPSDGVDIAIEGHPGGTRLRARIHGAEAGEVRFDVVAGKPANHEALAVVVPWSDRRFQYTVKDVARPAHGWVQIGSEYHEVPGASRAVLDHGRGRWPYNITGNWRAGAGASGGSVCGVQVGGKWTDGTGSTENSVHIDV